MHVILFWGFLLVGLPLLVGWWLGRRQRQDRPPGQASPGPGEKHP
jgi:hypothetical protein